jgi:beta-lactamase superfamily II metal-dependent hydrolase
MMKRVAGLVVSSLLLAGAASARPLDIYFIDVEGGQATLIVGGDQSLLIDAGYGGRGARDAERILAAARDAHIDRIDYLLITHFHNDHVGGVPDLVERMPIGTFIDYGSPLGTPLGPDRMTVRAFQAYEPVRAAGHHLQPAVGDHLPVKGMDVVVVTAGGTVLSDALPGAGAANDACATVEHQPDDGTENYRSIGVMLRFGEFTFLDLGDVSGDTLASLVCPRDLLGKVSAFLIPHHGNYDTNIPAVYAAVKPRAAIMNNGPVKGGDPSAFHTLHRLAPMDLWQLHASRNRDAANTSDERVANVDDDGSDGYWIKLSAESDGSFTVMNQRTGFRQTYARPDSSSAKAAEDKKDARR